jgi:O-antigen/teichoic acid export membrane protein
LQGQNVPNLRPVRSWGRERTRKWGYIPIESGLMKNISDNHAGFFRRRIVFGICSGWGSQLISLVMGLVTLPMFFRYLPKDELGIWMFFLGTSFFANLADFGFSPVLGRQLSFELGKGDRDSSLNYAGSSYYFSLSRYVSTITAPILFCGMLLIGGLFIWTLQLPAELLVPSFEAWGVFCLSQAVTCRSRYLETVLNSHGEVGWQNWLQTAVQLTTLIGYFVVLHFWHGGIIALTMVVLGRNLLNALWCWLLVRSRIDRLFRAGVNVAWHDVKPHLRPAMDMFLVSLGAFLVLNTDQYFIVKFLGASALPDYAAAYRLVHVVFTFASTASAVCIPFISRRSAAGDSSGIHRMLMLNATAGMIIQIAAVSIIAVFGDYILQMWLGKGHFVGWGVLWAFCIMLTLENHHVIFARFGMSAITDPTWGKMSIISGAINVTLTFIGVMWFGLLGVALGTMIAQMLTNNWYAVAKTLQIIQLQFLNYVRSSGIVWLATWAVLLICMFCVRSFILLPMASLLTGIGMTVILSSGILYLYLKSRQVFI